MGTTEKTRAMAVKRRLKTADRREDILNHAAGLFLTHGPAATSTRMIAHAVGISQPSLYAHFPTKGELANALAVRAFDILSARISSIKAKEIAPQRRLEAIVRGYIQFALEEGAAYRIAFMIETPEILDSVPDPHCLPGMVAFDHLKHEVQSLQDQGLVCNDPIDLLSQSLWASMHGLCALLIARPAFPWAEQDDLIEFHLKAILKGISA